MTYFVALLTLDERRLQANRKNFCCWKKVPVDVDDCERQMGVAISPSMEASKKTDCLDKNTHQKAAGEDKHFSERFMLWYAEQLIRPRVKVMVLLAFFIYFIICTHRMTLLTQEFNVEDYTVRLILFRGGLDHRNSNTDKTCFTLCCSLLTPTFEGRLVLWTRTIR